MGKTVLVLLITICAIVFSSSTVSAQSTADSSANLVGINPPAISIVSDNYAQKKSAIVAVLKRYDSPMIESVDSFIAACRTYNLDCYLLPSIAGLESTFGQFIWPGSYNAFGWDRGYMEFKSWDESIMTVGAGLRENYVNAGLSNVYAIGSKYSESLTWSIRISNLMQQFEEEEQNNKLFFSQSIVEL